MPYITTKTAANILGVSTTTIRRYANSGLLKCTRLSYSKHRRFETSELERLLNAFIAEGKTDNATDKPLIIKASAHPKHYLMHRYWGRKAHNIIEHYIQRFTKINDLVLDPFMGSGVVLIESAKLKRKSKGIDINPLSKFIVDNTISKIDFNELKKTYGTISKKLKANFFDYYLTKCNKCNSESTIEVTVWNKKKLAKIRLKCPTHGIQNKKPTSYDKKKILEIKKVFTNLESKNKLKYPKDKIFKYVKRSGVSAINELFTPRALIILSFLLKEINKIKDEPTRECFKFIFSSMLPNVSRMIPGDIKKGTYKSGWVISKFWVPTVHTERSIFHCFNLRYSAIIKGKSGVKNLKQSLVDTYVADSKKLPLANNSIDYIFTDPPYGESIAYLALCHFWNSWLKMTPKYSNEIIIDPYRKMSANDFSNNLSLAFKEMYRVLKPGKYLSFTFHSRDLNIWKGILEGCLNSGFVLKEVVLQPQAVSSGTQGINRKNTLKGDFIYTFSKPLKTSSHISINYHDNSYSFIVNIIYNYLFKKHGATTSELYEYIIPEIIKNYAYLNENKSVIDLEKLIQSNFIYKKNGNAYKWGIKDNLSESLNINVIDLFAGAGGFSEGFKQAGFNIVLAIENNPKHRETYSYNHQNTKLVVDDVENVAADGEKKNCFSISKYLSEQNILCDIIIGGPPCQGFSMAGMRIRKKYKLFSDERNFLFLEYYRIVKHINPKVFVLENVPGILNFNNGSIKNEISSAFTNLGYNVHADVLNAANFGVPQNRKRAIFIGNNLGMKSKDLFPKFSHINKYTTVGEAIGDLPRINSGEGADEIKKIVAVKESSDYQKLMNSSSNGLIFNHLASNHSKETLKIMKLIKPGEGLKDLSKKYRTKSIHSGAYGRMENNEPAYTLTTRLNTPSVGRITHPLLNRTITPREAARIQSFPDNYRFFGDITTLGIQIGNSVPPLLAKSIAKNIRNKCFSHLF